MEWLQITIHARDDKRNELLRTCRLIVDQTLTDKGCRSSLFYQDDADANIIILEQQWEQSAALKDYFRSDRFSALIGAMKWLGRTYEVRINRGTHNEGMDAVERARG